MLTGTPFSINLWFVPKVASIGLEPCWWDECEKKSFYKFMPLEFIVF